jgi:predicted nucleotidyltransferase
MAVLTPDVAAAVIRLRLAFDAEETILFGSRAYGTARPDSDVDLLVVLRTAAEPSEALERHVRQALAPAGWCRVDPHVWAYTPDELRQQLRRGSTAVRDALAKGKRLFPTDGQSRYAVLAEQWSVTGAKETLLEKAQDDLFVARSAWWTVAFHAQQAAAKALQPLSTTSAASPPHPRPQRPGPEGGPTRPRS